MRQRAQWCAALIGLALLGCQSESGETDADDAGCVGGKCDDAYDDDAVSGPRLVVLIVIDQLPLWSFNNTQDGLSGGIARLIDEGSLVPGRYPYAATLTAPGHCALGTGAPPAITGVASNGRFDRSTGEVVSAVEDPQEAVFDVLGGPGATAPGGASPRQSNADALGAALARGTAGRGKSVGISIKDRGAILPLGAQADLAVWYDAKQQAMTTSTFYADETPAWLTELARTSPIPDRLGYVWTPLDTNLLETFAPDGDEAPGEGVFLGLPNTFPISVAESDHPPEAFSFTPAADEMLLETALAAIDGEELGADDVPDLLTLSFSTHDKASHLWTQESWERTDILFRLDRELGGFFDTLDQRLGEDGWAVVLTSDHGGAPRVERSDGTSRGTRIAIDDVETAMADAASAVLGEGEWIAHTRAQTAWVSDAFLELPQMKQAEAYDAIITAIENVPGMQSAWRAERLRGDCEEREGIEAAVCWSLPLDRTGELYYVPKENSLVWEIVGTAHGTPWDYDREVPIIVRAPGKQVTALDYGDFASTLQVAPTVASLLGVAPPRDALTGSVFGD